MLFRSNGFKSFTGFYINSLKYWINKQKTISIFIIFIIASSTYLFSFSKKELLPVEDRGSYLIIGSTDEGSSFEYTQEKAQIIEGRILKLLQAVEIDRMKNNGYKTNKTGFELGTNFEYYEDFNLGFSTRTFYNAILLIYVMPPPHKLLYQNYPLLL